MHKHLFFEQLYSLVENEPSILANISNITALINQTFEDINWVIFYFLDKNELVLGPFQGKVACTRIPLGKGVCGVAAMRNEVLRVDNVHEFQGHIACDFASRSEIVIPIVVNYQVIGVLDIDSPSFNRFTKKDEQILKEAVHIIEDVVFQNKDDDFTDLL